MFWSFLTTINCLKESIKKLTRNLKFQAKHIQSRKSDIRSDTPESFPATVLDFSFEIIKIN